MKKLLSAVICYVLIIMLTSCVPNDFPDNPYIYEGYRWRAIEANIYFDVSVKYYDVSSYPTQGNVTINDNSYTFAASIAPSGNMDFYILKYNESENTYSNEERFLEGKIKKYKEEKFILGIFDDFQNVFGEHIETLTFIREPTPDYEAIDSQSHLK